MIKGAEAAAKKRKAATAKKRIANLNKPRQDMKMYCGAKRRSRVEGKSGVCMMKAGWGTDHPGVGRCKHHSGTTRSSRASGAVQEAILMGAPMDINPLDALVWCIRITAGEVEFCNKQLAELDKKDWLENSMFGEQIHLWARERQKAVDRLANYSKTAISLGIAEKAVRLAEQYGAAVSRYTKGLLNELMPYLTDDGKEMLPYIVKRHMLLLEGVKTPLKALDTKTRAADEAADAAIEQEAVEV